MKFLWPEVVTGRTSRWDRYLGITAPMAQNLSQRLLQIIASVATAILTALGATSCMGLN